MAVRLLLVGKSKSGKTWAADYLRRTHGFKKESLKDPLHQFLRKLYYYEPYARIRWETRLRYYDAFYKVDPDVWVGYMERRLHTTTRDVVVDDPRYFNEVAKLKTLGFKVIRIVAPESRRKKRLEAYKFAGEGLLDYYDRYSRDFDNKVGVDYSVYNDTKESTAKTLDRIVEELKKLDSETSIEA